MISAQTVEERLTIVCPSDLRSHCIDTAPHIDYVPYIPNADTPGGQENRGHSV